MKKLLILMFLFPLGASAQCFMPVDGAAVRVCPVDPGNGQYGPNSCPMGGALPWLDITGSLVPTADDIQTCQGYWVSTAEVVRNAEPSAGGSVDFNPEQLNQLLEALMYIGCCICFCLGFNANEGSAK